MRIAPSFPFRTALLSGAASGIGLALSEALAARGCSVVLADVDVDRAGAAAQKIASTAPAGTRVEALALDVADRRSFSAVAARASELIGDIQLLVNNAGTMVGGEVRHLAPEHWDRVLDVNLKGAIHGIEALYPAMVERGRGHVVNVSSVLGLTTVPLVTPYATSKFGLVGLSLGMRPEAALHGVGVTVVCPGIVETPLLDRDTPAGLPAPSSAPPMRAWTGLGMGRPHSPERLAAEILVAIERDRAILVTPWRARLAWRLSRLFPGIALRLMQMRLSRAIGPK